MQTSIYLGDATLVAGNPESRRPNSRFWGVILGGIIGRFGCAVLLLIAAALKSYQLFTDPLLGVHQGTRWLQVVLIDYELILAIWLLSGVGLRWGRRISIVTFLGFGCFAFFLGISGKESCGCFGIAHVSPWWTFGIDAALASSLFTWNPQHVKHGIESGSSRPRFTAQAFFTVPAGFAVIGIPILSIAFWQPESESPMGNSFANNRFVLLEPEKWIGRPFPLVRHIHMAEHECLSQGSWLLVLYHHDCPKCQQALPRYERRAKELKMANDETIIALIEMPPYGPAILSDNPLFHHGRLSDSKEWLIMTPAEVRLIDGQVTAATLELISEESQ